MDQLVAQSIDTKVQSVDAQQLGSVCPPNAIPADKTMWGSGWVRVVCVGGLGCPCGGTHVANTAEIKSYALITEEGLGKGVRRVLGVTGEKAEAAFAAAAVLREQVEAAKALDGEKLAAESADIVLAHGADCPLQQLGFVVALSARTVATARRGVVWGMGASLVQRLQMMELLAAADDTGRTCCGLTGHALFVDKAAALQALCAPGARVHMLVGFDTWIRITDPKYYGEGQVRATT